MLDIKYGDQQVLLGNELSIQDTAQEPSVTVIPQEDDYTLLMVYMHTQKRHMHPFLTTPFVDRSRHQVLSLGHVARYVWESSVQKRFSLFPCITHCTSHGRIIGSIFSSVSKA